MNSGACGNIRIEGQFHGLHRASAPGLTVQFERLFRPFELQQCERGIDADVRIGADRRTRRTNICRSEWRYWRSSAHLFGMPLPTRMQLEAKRNIEKALNFGSACCRFSLGEKRS